MKILVVGSGGREHALALRLLRDHEVESVHVYPGNPGMKLSPRVNPTLDESTHFEGALKRVRQEGITLVVIGPEAQLFQGWVDQFKKENIAAFGPSQDASFLEESKIKSKLFMREAKVPTAAFEQVQTLEQAISVIKKNSNWAGYVLKLSGPALGKGVIVTTTKEEAMSAAQDFFKFRPPGIEEGMVIEEKISGKEVSLFYVCMNQEYQFLASACDHKRLKDHDEGPNTGGMGAYSPATWVSDELISKIEKQFLVPTLFNMEKRGTPFCGILFLGVMVKDSEPYLLEYNVRFGDPETQTFLPRLEGDFAGLLHAVASHDLQKFREIKLSQNKQHSIHIVKAAKGYPGLFGEKIESGELITLQGEIQSEHSQVYFAGVKEVDGKLYSSGGRVLGITVVADTVPDAQKLAYQNVHSVSFSGEQYRRDIGANR